MMLLVDSPKAKSIAKNMKDAPAVSFVRTSRTVQRLAEMTRLFALKQFVKQKKTAENGNSQTVKEKLTLIKF